MAALGLCLATPSLHASDAKSYQVTATTITVQKSDDQWQIASDPATTGKLKVGDKVTIHYQMIATSVEVKAVKKSNSSCSVAELKAIQTGFYLIRPKKSGAAFCFIFQL